jgi:hypothetical protein
MELKIQSPFDPITKKAVNTDDLIKTYPVGRFGF